MSEKPGKMPFKFDAWHIKKGIWIGAEQMEREDLILLPACGQFAKVGRRDPQFTVILDWLIPVAYTGVNDMNGTEARNNDAVIFEGDMSGGKAQGVVCWHRNGWYIRYMLCHLCAGRCEDETPDCAPLPLGSSPFWITGNMYERDFKYEEAVADAGESELAGS